MTDLTWFGRLVEIGYTTDADKSELRLPDGRPVPSDRLERFHQMEGRLSNVAYVANAIDRADGVATPATSVDESGERQFAHLVAMGEKDENDVSAAFYMALRRLQREDDKPALRAALTLQIASERSEISGQDALAAVWRKEWNDVPRDAVRGRDLAKRIENEDGTLDSDAISALPKGPLNVTQKELSEAMRMMQGRPKEGTSPVATALALGREGVTLPLYDSDHQATGRVAVGFDAIAKLYGGFGKDNVYRTIQFEPARAVRGLEPADLKTFARAVYETTIENGARTARKSESRTSAARRTDGPAR